MRRLVIVAMVGLGGTQVVLAQSQTSPIILPDLSKPTAPPSVTAPALPDQGHSPTQPRTLPPGVGQTPPATPTKPPTPGQAGNPPPTSDVALPYPEKKTKLDAGSVIVRRAADGWQVLSGNTLVKNFGEDKTAAEDAAKAIRDLGAIEWATVGAPRPVVGYAISDDPAKMTTLPKQFAPIDLLSVRTESVRGTWVVRDANAIVLNFGPDRAGAEQAAAVVRKYGFNRVGFVGPTGAEPSFSFFFVAQEVATKTPAQAAAMQKLVASHQEQTMTRTGVPVPGAGFLGERLVIDPKKIAVRKDGYHFVIGHGTDTIADFGGNEWSARDAARVLQEMKVTEFCKVGGQTFFLVNGKAPDRVPFAAQGLPFDPKSLIVRQTGEKFGVYERQGRQVFPAASKEEGEALIRTVQGFGFDQTCRVGPAGQNSLTFLGKSR